MTTDLTKYEGHTEGPWWINHEDGDGATSIWSGTIDEADMNHVADVDAHDSDLRLVVDAPLLLKEVKYLRSVINAYLNLEIETSPLNTLELLETAIEAAAKELIEG